MSTRYLALGVLIVLALCIVVSVLSPSTPPQPSTPAPSRRPVTPTATPTVKDSILAAIVRPSRDDAPAPRVIIAGDGKVAVNFPAQAAWDGPAIHRQAQRQIAAIARIVRDHPLGDLKIVVTFPLVDKYGNSQEATIIRASLSRATLERINFDAFRPADLPIVADFYWQHPALAE